MGNKSNISLCHNSLQLRLLKLVPVRGISELFSREFVIDIMQQDFTAYRCILTWSNLRKLYSCITNRVKVKTRNSVLMYTRKLYMIKLEAPQCYMPGSAFKLSKAFAFPLLFNKPDTLLGYGQGYVKLGWLMQGIPLSSPVLFVLNCRSESSSQIQRKTILPCLNK